MDEALSLDRHGPLGRFDVPVEADYQRWLALGLRPLSIAMGVASVLAWIFVPPVIQLAMSGVDVRTVYLVGWAVNLPLLLASLGYATRAQVPRTVALSGLAVAVTAIDNLVWLNPALHVQADVFLGTAVFYGLLCPLMHLPLRTTCVVAAIVTTLGLAEAAAVEGPWDKSMSVIATGLCLGVLLVGPTMAWTSERGLRTAYANEQIIERQRQLIRRYAPSSVVSRIELDDHTVDHPQRRKVTVFFSDVVGFTTMADRVDPEALAEIVNDYLGSLADLIERHGGTLNEFAGDGVMAIFGAPDEMAPPEQVRAAVAAAQELQASLPEWSGGWYQHGIVEDAKARIGINTGTVSVGTFGSAVRATYTGIGLQTNIAARVQAQAEPGGILLSNTSWHLVKDTVACEPRGQVMVKGVHFPIELYAPVASAAGS